MFVDKCYDVSMLVDHLRAIVSSDPAGLSWCVGGLEDLVEVRGLLDRIEGACLVELARVDRAKEATQASGLSSSDWFATECHRTRGESRFTVAFAKKLVGCGSVADRVVDGTISLAQARVICAALTQKTMSLFVDFEAELFALVPTLSVDELVTVMARWKMYADEVTAAEDHHTDNETRAAFLSKFGSRNLFALNATLTAEQGETLAVAVDAIMSSDWQGNEETRTMPQRRVDAIAELGRHWLATNNNNNSNTTSQTTSHGVLPHIDVEVQLGDLIELTDRSSFYREFIAADPGNAFTSRARNWAGGLGGSTPSGSMLHGATITRFCCDSFLRFVLKDGPVVLAAGNKTRTIPVALRQLVISRDRHCRYPGCNRSVTRCEVHHVKEWMNGGTHELSNLILLCDTHHHRVHHEHETLILHADGRLDINSTTNGLLRTRSSFPPPTAGDTAIRWARKHRRRRRNEHVPNPEFIARRQTLFNYALAALGEAYDYTQTAFETDQALFSDQTLFQQRINTLIDETQTSFPINYNDLVAKT